jgi:uncharacterized MAPEG superfamily protein
MNEGGVAMSIPVLVLLAFGGWTLLTLFGSIGVYRWRRILTGRASVAEWRADLPQGSEWYQRAMRAHMNCIENLPIYTAVVIALMATGMQSSIIDRLAIALITSRIAQTLVHIVLAQTNAVASVRFGLFCLQVLCMITMGAIIIASVPLS